MRIGTDWLAVILFVLSRMRKSGQGRNDTGHKLACELHNLGLSAEQALGYMEKYHSEVPQDGDPYTWEEADQPLIRSSTPSKAVTKSNLFASRV